MRKSGGLKFRLRAGLVLGDVPGDGAGRNCQGTGEIHLSRSAAAGEIPVLRTDDDLIATG